MKPADLQDDGFTLLELLIAVIMTAVIIGAIAAALTTALRNDAAAGERIATAWTPSCCRPTSLAMSRTPGPTLVTSARALATLRDAAA